VKYLPRIAEKLIRKYLSFFPAVAITGPRQSGKSTTLRNIFSSEYRYITFDDPLQVEYFESDPKGFFKEMSDRVIFDEVQKVPGIFPYLKMAIDSDRQNYGKFILTGSSQFALIKDITESLAGRIGSVSLLPFQFGEIPEKLRSRQILEGSYPELVTREFAGAREWYAAYISNYIERDVRSLLNVGSLKDFRRLILLLAARVSQEFNASTLARELGVSVKTVQSWISVLEASYIVYLLPSYHRNLGKRIVKRPKLYFYDTGIVCYLTGLRDYEMLDKGPLAGPVFENYCLAEILKGVLHSGADISLYYFRSNSGLETDIIIQDRDRDKTLYLEVKNTATARFRMIEPLKKLIELEEANEFLRPAEVKGFLLYKGSESPVFSDNIYVENYRNFLQSFTSGIV
jgi:predicted AAA+ superfamily ATPase